jgi:hypothetical protein
MVVGISAIDGLDERQRRAPFHWTSAVTASRQIRRKSENAPRQAALIFCISASDNSKLA